MRCLVCGRVIAGTGSRLPAEKGDCEGCQDEFKAALAATKPDGSRQYDNEQAFALARANHYAREGAKFDAIQAKNAAQVSAAGKKVADDWAEALK